MKGFAATLFVILSMAFFMARPNEAVINCGQVSSYLSPCLSYLKAGGSPPAPCCAGVKNLRNNLQTTQDKQTACNCAKSAATKYPNLNPAFARDLPGKCGVVISFPISAQVDCSKVS